MMKGRGGVGYWLKREGGIKFLSLKRRVGLERGVAYLTGGVIEDLRYSKFI